MDFKTKVNAMEVEVEQIKSKRILRACDEKRIRNLRYYIAEMKNWLASVEGDNE